MSTETSLTFLSKNSKTNLQILFASSGNLRNKKNEITSQLFENRNRL